MVWVCVMFGQSQGHKVNVFAYVEGDRVVVEGYFSGNAKARDTLVQVFDETGKKVVEGKTDQKGIYSFKLADLPPFSGSLKIVLDAEMGHKAEYTLSASDLPDSAKRDVPSRDQPPIHEPRKQESANAPAIPVGGATQQVDQAALAAALGTLLDKKLEPIVKMLGKQERLLLEEKQRGPRISDIVGGLGWIVGLVGLAAFLWGRNRPSGQ